MESKQDTDSYTEKTTSKGMGLGVNTSGQHAGNKGISGGNTKGDIHSDYESVTSQAGIYAGKEGYTIEVKENTDLKGAVIESLAAPDKNSLTTGTLTWEHIDSRADYKASTSGTSIHGDYTGKNTTGGATPIKTQDIKGEADSTTKTAVAEGTITITDKEHQSQNIEELNRDTKNTLNKLEQIFDKEDIKERQELVNNLSQLMNEKIGDIAAEQGWEKDDSRRALLHALGGGISAALGGGNAVSGAAGAGVMESLQPILDEFIKDNPDMREWAAAMIGGAIGKLTGDTNAGEAGAWSSTKFNWLTHEQYDEYVRERTTAVTQEEIDKIEEKWLQIDDEQGDIWLKKQGEGEYIGLRNFGIVITGSSTIEYNWKNSLLNNLLIERSGDMWELAIAEGKLGGVWKYTGKLGGPAGIPIAFIEPYQDYYKYSGVNLYKAWMTDMFPVVGGFSGSFFGPLGTIAGGMGGDFLKYYIKQNIPTDEILKSKERMKK